ncbi:MAG: glycosyltransferase family 2 protein [Lachnospiraceae bacterium]|nr:glycosyltransferase family 2 protein [Lachnospiraceae bacterium]
MGELITVVIPVYNVKPYLEECFLSVINQSYSCLDIVVIDDGSTDGSGKVCDEWGEKDSRIRVIHQANSGLSAARNAGIDAAGGQYIAFLDSDDYYETDTIKDLYNCAQRNNADMVVGCGRWVSEEGNPLDERSYNGSERILSKEEFWGLFCDQQDFVVAWSKLYKKELFDTVRFPEGQINEDFGIARFVVDNANQIVYLNKSVYNYRIRQGSILRSPFSEKNLYLIGERLSLIDYILRQDFSRQAQYHFCRKQFPEAMDEIGNGFRFLNTKDIRVKSKLENYYKEYRLIAKKILMGIDGSVTPDFYTKLSLTVYLLSRRAYFFLRRLKKKG